MDNQTYQQIIGEIGTLITIFAPLLTAYKIALALGFDKYIDSKIGLIKDEKLRKVAENIKNRVEDLAVNTITMLEAVEKPIIIENIKNGSMTKSDLVNLKSKAIETIKGQLTTEGQTDLQNTVGDVNTYLETLIEAKLADLKVDNTSSVSKTEISMPTSEELDNETLRNQLAQIQADKQNIVQELEQVKNDKTNIEQNNAQLINQVNDLTTQNLQFSSQVSDLTNKLNAITSTVSQYVSPVTQPVSDSSNATVQTQLTDGQTIAQ
jgi:hypothetical protein